jgi:predicted O-methyltransferase YrrM
VINRRVLLYVVALATAATVALGLIDRADLAIAALAIAVASMFGWILLWARALNGRVAGIDASIERHSTHALERIDASIERRSAHALERIDASIERHSSHALERIGELGRAVDSLGARLGSNQQDVARRADGHDEKLGRLRRDLYGVQVAVQRTPSITTELGRVYRRLVHHDHPMPELGGWSMTGATLVWVIDQIWSGRVSTILECGSGSSTVWFALALEQRGTPGRIVSLESSAEYADETRARLDDLGLAHRAEVLTAPLVDLDLPGRATQPWFDQSVLSDDITGVDLLFVDGPVGDIAPEARYPALPVLADRLTADALVVLDDTGRADEENIVELWSDETYGSCRYEVVHRLDRATALRSVC